MRARGECRHEGKAVMDKRLPRPKADYRLEELDGEMLLYHPAETKTIYLNETASLIWSLCDGTRTVADIAKLLEESFPEPGVHLIDDVADTIDRFAADGAVEL